MTGLTRAPFGRDTNRLSNLLSQLSHGRKVPQEDKRQPKLTGKTGKQALGLTLPVHSDLTREKAHHRHLQM